MATDSEVRSDWFTMEDVDTMSRSVYQYTEALEKSQSGRVAMFRLYAAMYLGSDNLKFYSRTGANTLPNTQNNRFLTRPQHNIVRSCVDTVNAKIAKNKPRVMLLTTGADEQTHKRAKKLGDVIESLFLRAGVYKTMSKKVDRDAKIFGTGLAKVYRTDTTIELDHVMPLELIVDDAEAIHGIPRQMHQVKYIAREQLLTKYVQGDNAEDIKKLINSAEEITITEYTEAITSIKMVRVVESWYLSSGKGADDGVTAVSISTGNLLKDKYKYDKFPFVVRYWCEPLQGFWGQGLAEQLRGVQFEINKYLLRIQENTHLGSVMRVFLKAGSKIVKSHITNEVGAIIEYVGDPPTFFTPTVTPPDVFSHLDRLREWAYSDSGVSQMSAQSRVAPNLDSKVAIDAVNDIETERFVLDGQGYEDAFIEIAEWFKIYAKEIFDEKGAFPVLTKTNKGKNVEQVMWQDVDIEDDKYLMEAFPISFLPSTPAGRLEKVEDLIRLGIVGEKEEILNLLDAPDIEAYTNSATAGSDFVEFVIQNLQDGKQYIPPEPTMDLTLGIAKMVSAYLRARTQNTEPDVLMKMRQWITQATTILNPKPPPTPQQGGMPGQPPGMPMAQPQGVGNISPPSFPQGNLINSGPAMLPSQGSPLPQQ